MAIALRLHYDCTTIAPVLVRRLHPIFAARSVTKTWCKGEQKQMGSGRQEAQRGQRPVNLVYIPAESDDKVTQVDDPLLAGH